MVKKLFEQTGSVQGSVNSHKSNLSFGQEIRFIGALEKFNLDTIEKMLEPKSDCQALAGAVFTITYPYSPFTKEFTALEWLAQALGNGNLKGGGQEVRISKIMEKLLEANASVNGETTGNVPLVLLNSKKLDDFVRLLLTHKANPNAEDSQRRTPLSAVAASTHFMKSVVNLLVDNGADVNWKDSTGKTLLMLYTRKDEFELLLNKGADPKATDKDGHNFIYHHAIKRNLFISTFDKDDYENLQRKYSLTYKYYCSHGQTLFHVLLGAINCEEKNTLFTFHMLPNKALLDALLSIAESDKSDGLDYINHADQFGFRAMDYLLLIKNAGTNLYQTPGKNPIAFNGSSGDFNIDYTIAKFIKAGATPSDLVKQIIADDQAARVAKQPENMQQTLMLR